ncbi:MAG: arginine--tRNA ligase [Candidatus Omnitrophica bacterium]|nr:arginine--tRNA ligase [Candidatus Omnitrophota bacterium]
MFFDIRRQLQELVQKSLPTGQAGLSSLETVAPILIDIPADKAHGELSCNIALQLSRTLKKNPMAIAADILKNLQQELTQHPLKNFFANIEVKQPGFINFYLSPQGFYAILETVLNKKDDYGKSSHGARTPFCLEFVSANPTGPLTVAHGRQAAVGDSLVNVLKTVGYKAQKEYYVNDEGNQINILGRSIYFRAKEILGDKAEFPEDGYQGDYIRTIAEEFIKKHAIKASGALEKINPQQWRQFGADYLMGLIKKDLEDFNVHFDIWSYQSKIATTKAMERVLADFNAKGYIYEHEGAWWFKSTQWGDDKDRVVKKSNGEYTYLTPDIVYHQDKFARGFKHIVDILGPDHHGYIPRIKAAAAALGKSVDDLDVVIVQLATIYRSGKPVSMSTRRGEFITLREVMDEVGTDAARFFFLMRQTDAHLDFDLELAKKTSAENPVYYIQYAHARIHSIIRKATDESHLTPRLKSFSLLKEVEEMDLMRKMALYPQVLLICAKQLDPFALGRYLQELAGCFHKFYDAHRVLDENKELSRERLALIEAARIVLGNGLRLLGVTAPEKM